MAQIAVAKMNERENETHSLRREMETLQDRIRERAYGIFEQRGDGAALDHWLEAERDLMVTPESDLVEKDSSFELNVALDDFEADDLRVSALPGALIVQGFLGNKRTTDEDGMRGFEASGKTLCAQIDLPVAIDVDRVTARFDSGVLRVTAPKAMLETAAADKRQPTREKAPSARTAAA
jgi:HSP20 family molecular chaperone IbpA